MIYQTLIRPLLFKLPPERAHAFALRAGAMITKLHAENALRAMSGVACDKRLVVRVAGIDFPNPVGLAAGVDKDCHAAPFFSALGFGHLEIGTVTRVPQSGNPTPRLFRLPEQHALINRLGFPSEGVAAVLPRLQALRARSKRAVIGVNIGKSRDTPLDRAVDDYVFLLKQVSPLADYVAINISSPNTPELRRLQEPDRLRELFGELNRNNAAAVPIFVKLSPDLTQAELQAIVEVLVEVGVGAIIACNTTLDRSALAASVPYREEVGGLSGAPLRQRSLEVVRSLSQMLRGSLPIIGVGGISSGQDARAMLDAGAALIQIYSGLVYQGPALVRDILTAILRDIEVTAKSSSIINGFSAVKKSA